MDARCRQRQHPANIGRIDKMPSRTQQMRAQDRACRECFFNVVVRLTLQTQSTCPFRACEVLSLNSAQPLHYISRFTQRKFGNALIAEPLTYHVQAIRNPL